MTDIQDKNTQAPVGQNQSALNAALLEEEAKIEVLEHTSSRQIIMRMKFLLGISIMQQILIVADTLHYTVNEYYIIGLIQFTKIIPNLLLAYIAYQMFKKENPQDNNTNRNRIVLFFSFALVVHFIVNAINLVFQCMDCNYVWDNVDSLDQSKVRNFINAEVSRSTCKQNNDGSDSASYLTYEKLFHQIKSGDQDAKTKMICQIIYRNLGLGLAELFFEFTSVQIAMKWKKIGLEEGYGQDTTGGNPTNREMAGDEYQLDRALQYQAGPPQQTQFQNMQSQNDGK